ncbi:MULTISPECIES: AAA family ATPase [unclassified Rhodococcus (in: high G+C Gram-positive bacteria)]|uniref:AAA family ATPase n=1 Tax=unclassified Rhodococcus (in: high G+C Gram-positive bacteria) TaxID=192944 RepID=UPI0015C676AD|nr:MULTISPECIES: AAA family ATPase [unclassified Rhodococcus (in: high G+C Gram-positive bacteria)]
MDNATASLGFTSLEVHEWRQFEQIDIRFHPRLTILTGGNASGKTTLLGLLGRHLNWHRTYMRSRSSVDEAGTRFLQGRKKRRLERSTPDGTVPAGWDQVGTLIYNNGITTSIGVPSDDLDGEQFGQYDIALFSQQPVDGLFLPSHRQLSIYQQVTDLPLQSFSAQSLLQTYTQELRLRQVNAGGYVINKTPMSLLKQGLIASALFGEGNSSVEGDPKAREIWVGFQNVLRILVPESIKFDRLVVRRSEVLIRSDTAEYPIDEVSGGLSAIIEISWQIFLTSLIYENFTVVLDEPENHLHPILQKKLLADLLAAFPRAQFVVATHSPFVVSSVMDSFVYVLDHKEGSTRVRSRLLDQINKAGDADSVLREVLGVGSTLPTWAEDRFDLLVESFSSRTLDANTMTQLRLALDESGLAASFPKAMIALRKMSGEQS